MRQGGVIIVLYVMYSRERILRRGRRRSQKMLKFYVKVFKTLYFLNPQMDLVYIWYDYRCWSKNLLSSIHTPANDQEVKVMDLEILC